MTAKIQCKEVLYYGKKKGNNYRKQIIVLEIVVRQEGSLYPRYFGLVMRTFFLSTSLKRDTTSTPTSCNIIKLYLLSQLGLGGKLHK